MTRTSAIERPVFALNRSSAERPHLASPQPYDRASNAYTPCAGGSHAGPAVHQRRYWCWHPWSHRSHGRNAASTREHRQRGPEGCQGRGRQRRGAGRQCPPRDPCLDCVCAWLTERAGCRGWLSTVRKRIATGAAAAGIQCKQWRAHVWVANSSDQWDVEQFVFRLGLLDSVCMK